MSSIDGAGTLVSSRAYGPFDGWEAQRLVVGPDGRSRLLWRHVSGRVTIWTLDEDGSIASHPAFGPFAGWAVKDFAVAGETGHLHVSWTRDDGALAIWQVSPDASTLLSSVVYGPYAGWQALGLGMDSDRKRRLLWRNDVNSVGLWLEPGPYLYPAQFWTLGPYAGWSPYDFAAGSPDESARILWRHTSGAAGLWRHMPDGQVTSTAYGPYTAWTAVAVAVPAIDPEYADTYSRVLWRGLNGSAVLWSTTMSGQLRRSFVYGPHAGWTVVDVAAGPE